MPKYLFLLSCCVVSSPVFAQEAEEADVGGEIITFVHELPERLITVTASGLSTNVKNTGQSVTVIDRDEIASIQGADLTRVIQRIPSVTVSRNGPIGGFTGVNVRGAGAEQLLVLIDGVRVADVAAPGSGFDFGNLLAANVGKIDLLRGSNSTIWGSDAIAGVLDISTRGKAGLSGSLEYGARDTLTANTTGGLDGDRYYAGLTASWFQTDGFSAAALGDEADGFEQFALGGSAFFDATDQIELFVNGRYAVGDLEIDGFPAPSFALADTRESQETTQYSGALGASYFGQDLTLRATFSLSDTERTNTDPAIGETFTSDGESERILLRGEYRLIGGLKLAFGGEHEWQRYETLFDAGEDTEITGGYVQAGWELGDLAAHAGVRIDDHQRFGSKTSFGADVSYGFANDWRVRASVGEGFKAPTLFQLFSEFGNETLGPENSTSYDLGLERGTRGQGVHLAATVFRRDSENLIDFVSCFGSTSAICVDRPFGTYDNTDRARAQGVELEAGVDALGTLRLSGVYSFIDAEDRATGNRLARRPRHSATLFADWDTGLLDRWDSKGLALGADLRIVGDSFDDGGNLTRLDGYEVLDLRAALPLGENFELFGRVENIFDAQYQTVAGYGTPGRGGFVGVKAAM